MEGSLHTAIGVFSVRENAEAAFKELLDRKVPQEAIVFLTRSESQDATVGKELGATVGGFIGVAAGMTAGVSAAVLLVVPGIGQVVALGFGAAALLGLAGAGTGSALGKAAVGDSSVSATPDEKCQEDVEFFRKVLAEGHSLIVVRSESQEVAKVANDILCRLGMSMPEQIPIQMRTARRQIADVAIVDVSGRITVGEGSALLRELVRETLEQGNKKILFNLHEVGYIDSSGLGELVKSYTTVRSQGGQLKLVQVSKRVYDLLHMTKLNLVIEIEPDEATAIQSFGAGGLAQGTA
jgi:anti-sigma B factor antagonist